MELNIYFCISYLLLHNSHLTIIPQTLCLVTMYIYYYMVSVGQESCGLCLTRLQSRHWLGLWFHLMLEWGQSTSELTPGVSGILLVEGVRLRALISCWLFSGGHL